MGIPVMYPCAVAGCDRPVYSINPAEKHYCLAHQPATNPTDLLIDLKQEEGGLTGSDIELDIIK